MSARKSKSDPIYSIGQFEETAIRMPGAPAIPDSVPRPGRSRYEPIRQLATFVSDAIPLTEVDLGLTETLSRRLRASAEATLTSTEVELLRTWLDGVGEQEIASRLNWTADAVRAAREELLRRIHVTIDPPSS